MRRLGQYKAIDWLVGRVQHPYCEQVHRSRPERRGGIQFKGRFTPFVAANGNAVQPDLSQIIDRPKLDHDAAIRVRVVQQGELRPVPGYAMIIREYLLNNSRNSRRTSIGAESPEPFLRPPYITRIG
jgi:hypothetical protein